MNSAVFSLSKFQSNIKGSTAGAVAEIEPNLKFFKQQLIRAFYPRIVCIRLFRLLSKFFKRPLETFVCQFYAAIFCAIGCHTVIF